MDGREPETTTEYEYDDAGRLVRSVTTTEPRWTEQDRAEMFALAYHRDGLCPLCKQPLAECTSPEVTGPAFAADYTVCRATLALIEHQRAISEGGEKPRPNAPAYLWRTEIRR